MKIFSAVVALLIVAMASSVLFETYAARYVIGYAYYCGVMHDRPLNTVHTRACDMVLNFVEAVR